MARRKLFERVPDFDADLSAFDPLSSVFPPVVVNPPSLTDYWYRLGYRHAFSSNFTKAVAGIPRYWSPSSELTAYLDGKEDRQEGRPSRLLDSDSERPTAIVEIGTKTRTGLVALSGVLAGEKLRDKAAPGGVEK